LFTLSNHIVSEAVNLFFFVIVHCTGSVSVAPSAAANYFKFSHLGKDCPHWHRHLRTRALPLQPGITTSIPAAPSHVRRPAATTKLFLDLCIAEKNQLNFNNKGLTKLGWQHIYRNFREQTGLQYDNKQLQDKLTALKRAV
jgi:hypothetical protein